MAMQKEGIDQMLRDQNRTRATYSYSVIPAPMSLFQEAATADPGVNGFSFPFYTNKLPYLQIVKSYSAPTANPRANVSSPTFSIP